MVVKFDGCACGEIGGDAALDKYSLCDGPEWNGPGLAFAAATAFECWAADIFASNDWNDVLDEYNALTPGGNIGDGCVLYENEMEKNIKWKSIVWLKEKGEWREEPIPWADMNWYGQLIISRKWQLLLLLKNF